MNIKNITPDLLDNCLSFLLDNCSLHSGSQLSAESLEKELEVNNEDLINIFSILEHHNIIRNWEIKHKKIFIFFLQADAHDLYNKGGFKAKYEVIEKQMILLQSELDKLKPTLSLDSINNITSIIATVYQFYDRFK
ncbi:MAG: hypothetical protein N4A35_05345 [Flavobacteriales bacterium]|jgi:hypothetical protein|nr:hypothetical protein [Flavobacteriales bacterium]